MVRKSIAFLFENSAFLMIGAVWALIWANLNSESYHHFVHLQVLDGGATIHFLVNDVFMALFFAIAAKEVRESFLPGGALSDLRKAATPLIATLGGVIVPAAMYVFVAWQLGRFDALARGWAIPCATDIAFSYMVARMVFGANHPAIAFLLLLAIADDGIGLLIIAVFYPQEALNPWWLLLVVAALILCVGMQKVKLGRFRLHSFWWYLCIPGAMSWIGFYQAGIHAALGLVPVIFVMPHAESDLGIFARDELNRHDTLNEFEHWWDHPVEIILGLFGLVNAGVVLSSVSPGTWAVLAGLLIGKPLGITMFALGSQMIGFKLPDGMRNRELIVLSEAAAIGFTVALFVAVAAFFEPGSTQDGAKMGALLSLGAFPLTWMLAKLLGVRRVRGT